jgi:hypothetical protein
MHFKRTVNTPVFHPERRAVDVNRPVTSLVRSWRGAGRPGTHRYRGIDIPRAPCCVHNRAATVRESGTLLAVKSICTGVSVSTRMSGCHALCALVRSWCDAGRPGTHRYRGIDIPRSPCCVDNRAATVRESGTLLAVKLICTGVSVSTRMSGCHAPCAHRVRVPCTLSAPLTRLFSILKGERSMSIGR